MPKFNVRITQVFRTVKQIVVEMEGEDRSFLRELLDDGGLEPPGVDDPMWKIIDEELQDEYAKIVD